MYCNFYRRDDGSREWFNLSLDNDDLGVEVLTILKNTVKKQLTEAINLDQFDKCQRLLNIADEVEEALAEAKAPKEEERAEDQPEDAGE